MYTRYICNIIQSSGSPSHALATETDKASKEFNQIQRAALLLYCLTVTCSCYPYLYFGSPIMWVTYLSSWMTTCLEKSCSFGLPRVPFVNCCQFMYLVISLLVLIWVLIESVLAHCSSFCFKTCLGNTWLEALKEIQIIMWRRYYSVANVTS